MAEPIYVQPRALENYVASDGQRFTSLVAQWADVYLRRCGAHNFSINVVAFRADGGVDGLIEDETLSDPKQVFSCRSVLQFKAGAVSSADARAELRKEPEDGQERVIDRIRSGFKLIWIVARSLPDLELSALEAALATVVEEINPDAPRPTVLDATRFSKFLSSTPAVALVVATPSELFNTTDAALGDTPHSLLPTFVPGAHFGELREDLARYFLDPGTVEPLKYLAGEPGIGKSRSVLEAIEQNPNLAGKVCYFKQPTRVEEFFTLARQERWQGFCVIDEYIGESSTTVPVTSDTVPAGLRVVLIGHAYRTNRLSASVTDSMVPLTQQETQAVLRVAFPDLPEFRINQAIDWSKNNLRLARFICEYLSMLSPEEEPASTFLERIVADELQRLPAGQGVLQRLSLVPNLLVENIPDFCELVGIDAETFRTTCSTINQSSGLIQFNDHVCYVGAPAVAQSSLLRLWKESNALARRVYSAPGKFHDDLVRSINRLQPSQEKEEMLVFFRMPVRDLQLADFLNPDTGTRLLRLLSADPETYVPALRRVMRASVGQLDQVRYETSGIGRRDLIWKARDLGQFAEYFEACEEIVYLFAREEVPSAYGNVASTYWPGWFYSYFDHTTYPYDRRLDLLEHRATHGDQIDLDLILQAVRNPFPDVGDAIPSDRVGGRLAPPELRFIHRDQIALAAVRVPKIVSILLSRASEPMRLRIGQDINAACYSWLQAGALKHYVEIVQDKEYPPESLRELIVQVRNFVEVCSDRESQRDEQVRGMLALHRHLLNIIDSDDPIIDALAVADHGYWGEDETSESYKTLMRLLDRYQAEEAFALRTVEILCDPAKPGGAHFAKLVSPHVRPEELDLVKAQVQERGLSQFSFAVLGLYAERDAAALSEIHRFARTLETTQTPSALSLYQRIGKEVYFAEAARLLNETDISSKYFQRFWIDPGEELEPEAEAFLEAILRRVDAGEAEARFPLALIAGAVVRSDLQSNLSDKVVLRAVELIQPEELHNSLHEWDDLAIWLLPRFSRRVISLAASHRQSEHSKATHVLATAAEQYPREVLNAIAPLLANAHKSPYLLTGALLMVISRVPEDVFRAWLTTQSAEVIETVAGHIPKPRLVEGSADVPAITREFWEFCTPSMGKTYEHAQSSFGAHTFSTGVYFGHGVDLFASRVTLARQLLNDENEGIRSWAQGFLDGSTYHLERARREQHLHDAMVDTSD